MCLFFSFQQSIPQTRAHFQNIVLGIAEWDRDVVWREEWEVEESAGVGSPRSAQGKEKDRGTNSRIKRTRLRCMVWRFNGVKGSIACA
jgi:hypothetical protein